MHPIKTFLHILLLVFAAALSSCQGERPAAVPEREDTMAQTNNHIDYVELAAEDLAAVKKFYGEAFGWEFQDWGPDYVSFSGAGLDGGIRGGEKPVQGSTLVILYADDLEASEKRVTNAGGEIVARHEFPGGKRFHFKDPAGNVLGVWTQVPLETE
jgi:predicted enzyme related to lactoylglutathione lyase